MKRSKLVALVLMGACLAGCGSGGNEEIMYKSRQECVDGGKFSEAECARFEAEAQKEAPKFASREECVAQFGEAACVNEKKEGGGGSFWMPMMAGFLAGQMLGGGFSRAQPLFQNPRGGGLITPAGKAAPAPQNISRGGFSGSRSASS